MLERPVLKNAAQRTSQHVKWTSGTRLTITVDRSIARAVARSIIARASRSSRSNARSLDRSVARSLGRSVARSFGRSVARSLDRSVDRSIARSLPRSIDRSLTRSVASTKITLGSLLQKTYETTLLLLPNVCRRPAAWVFCPWTCESTTR